MNVDATSLHLVIFLTGEAWPKLHRVRRNILSKEMRVQILTKQNFMCISASVCMFVQ